MQLATRASELRGLRPYLVRHLGFLGLELGVAQEKYLNTLKGAEVGAEVRLNAQRKSFRGRRRGELESSRTISGEKFLVVKSERRSET